MTYKERLKQEREEVLNMINHPNEYNLIHFFKRTVSNCKLVMIDLMPYIVAIAITLPPVKAQNRTPFIIDEISEREKIEIIDSSNGVHIEKVGTSSDVPITLEYSTGWKINEYNLYERSITRYILNNIDINDQEKIFSMTKEEMDAILIPMENQIITKEELSEDDRMYEEETITICSLKDTDTIKKVEESKTNNVLTTMLYIILCAFSGVGINRIGKIIFHDEIKNKIKAEKQKYPEINEREIQKLREKLKLIENDIKLFKKRRVR